MSYRSINTASGVGGGAICLLLDPGRARNIHIAILNNSSATHVAFFGRSRRELVIPGAIGIAGFAIPAVPNSVANQTVNNVAYTNYILLGWSGELWCAADVDNTLQIDAFESAGNEK